jgi:beta propeller repeat protein
MKPTGRRIQQLRKRFYGLVLTCFLASVLSLMTVGAMAKSGVNWVVSEVEPASRPDDRPAIYGDRVAWVEFQLTPFNDLGREPKRTEDTFWTTPPTDPLSLFDNWSSWPDLEIGFSYRVKVYDLVTGQLWDLIDDLPPCTYHLIDMYGDWVITEQVCLFETETIHAFNLQTNEYIKLTPYEVGKRNQWPSIDGDYVLWTVTDCCGTDIRMFDLDARTTISVTNDGGSKFFPDKSGDWVVWSGSGTNDIYAYNLATTEKITITNDSPLQWYPRISGNIVVWTDQRNDYGDVYGYDLATRQEFTVAGGVGTQNNQAIDGSLVSWTDYRDETFYISALDMATGEYFEIHGHPPDTTIFEPSMVYGDRVVWRYDLNQETYLYTAKRLRFQSYLPVVTR